MAIAKRQGVAVESAERASSFDIEAAYQRYFGSVWRYLALWTRNGADADELAQEAFERALRAISKGQGPEAGLWEPWLMLIARRLLITRYRRSRLVAWLPLDLGTARHAVASDCFDNVELNLWLDQITRVLSARQREALFLRYLGDLDDASVGMILGISASGVRSLVSRALAQIREREELWR